MKYFAILKDSLREALDSKVLYVMFGLSTLVILLVGSLSFKPLPPEKTMEQLFWTSVEVEGKSVDRPPTLMMILNSKSKEKANPQEIAMRLAGMHSYQLVQVELSRGDDDAPESDYKLTVSKRIPSKTQKENGFGLIAAFVPDIPEKRAQVVRDIFKEAESAGYLKVENVEQIEIEDATKETARFRVTVNGTAKTRRIWVTEPSWLFDAVPMKWMTGPIGIQMFGLAYLVIGIGSWVTVVVGIVVTSFFFPNMLRKGTVDLLLVKPVRRWVLLLYKYIGGLMFMFLSTAYAILGIWLVLGVRSGLWANGSLLLIFSLTFFFCILYAISTLVGVLTRSTVTSIMLTIFAYAVLGVLGFAHAYFEAQVKAEEMKKETAELKRLIKTDKNPLDEDHDRHDLGETHWADSNWVLASRVIQKISPRTEDLNELNTLILYTDFTSGNLADLGKFDTTERNWWESLLVCSIWIGIFLGLACLWFTYKDY